MFDAQWKVGERVVRILPRSKKTSFFKTQKAAETALERQARRLPNQDTFGRIYDADTGELVYTIAL